MIQAILVFKFQITFKETGEIEPEFVPIQSHFQDEALLGKDYQEIIKLDDLYGVYYQHTTWKSQKQESYDDLYYGKLKETPYQVVSYFLQLDKKNQYITTILFSSTDELSVYSEIISNLQKRMKNLLDMYSKASSTNQIALTTNISKKILDLLKFTEFQLSRLSELTKLQKAALIFSSQERLMILETLREGPISKNQLREKLEKVNKTLNLDALLEPFLDLSLIRRDWIEGKMQKKVIDLSKQGEYLFLIKDLIIVRVPNLNLVQHIKSQKEEFASKFEKRIKTYFSNYHPNFQTIEDVQHIASILLNPDMYDVFVFLKNKYYPLDKFPNISSEFTETSSILEVFKNLEIAVELKDKNKRPWIFLLTDIKPIVFFPEYLLPKIREAYKHKDKQKQISLEVAKKAFDLLEISYAEEVEF